MNMDNVTKTGYVIALKNENGYGFLSENPSVDERGIFFHFSDVVGEEHNNIKLGTKISYIELTSKKGKRAVQVKIIN